MVSVFVKEQKRYLFRELQSLFGSSNEAGKETVRKLKEYGLVKTVRVSSTQKETYDLLDEDIEISEIVTDSTMYYVFIFVGIVIVDDILIKCYPKYIFSKDKPLVELKQILRVLRKYNASEQHVHYYNEFGKIKTINMLGLMIFLLNDYHENGLYINEHEVIETNGDGELHWDRTINNSFALIVDERPYYLDYQTRKSVLNEYDYYMRLHACIISKISEDLNQLGLLDLFDILPAYVSDEAFDDFGDKEYILDRIDKEQGIQYITRKKTLLEALYSYVCEGMGAVDSTGICLYGTTSFNMVWEKTCASVFNNKLQIPLSLLQLPCSLDEAYTAVRDSLLIDLIEKPAWLCNDYTHIAKDTLIPDIITIEKMDNRWYFIILDAKYYTPQIECDKPLRGQPGIESITKQYLYQLAYRSFVVKHNIDTIKNCFILPTEKDEIINKGIVSMKMLNNLNLQSIQVRLIPAKKVFACYLDGKQLSIKDLELT